MIEHRTPIRVYYKDVDQMGIVYYSRYLEFFEMARTELLNGLGLPVRKIENSDYFLPVITSHCDYKGSARFEDRLVVVTRIRALPKPRLHLEYEVLREGETNPLVTGYTDHAFINHDNRPVRPPKDLLNLLASKLKQKETP